MSWSKEAIHGVKCGEFMVKLAREGIHMTETESIDKEICGGFATQFNVSYGSNVTLPVVYLECENGTRDIRIHGEVQGPQALRRLEHGLRMSVFTYSREQNMDWVQLSQARLNPKKANKWSNLYKGTRQQLEGGAGFDVLHYLLENGAIFAGKKREILDAKQSLNYLCITLSADNQLLPVLAYVSTRVLPLFHEYQGDQMRLQ